METRTLLTKKASDLSENARISIRAARHQGQKDLKADQDNKVVGESDARKDSKHVWQSQIATTILTDESSAHSCKMQQRSGQMRLTRSLHKPENCSWTSKAAYSACSH